MTKGPSLEIITDGTGGAFAVNHLTDQTSYAQSVLGTDLELRYDAVRLLVPWVYGLDNGLSSAWMAHWKALKSLEMATRTLLVAVPRTQVSSEGWRADLKQYEALARTSLDWSVRPMPFDGSSPPQGDALFDLALHVLQSVWDETASARGDDTLRCALTSTAPTELNQQLVLAAAQRAYAGRDYAQKRFASFIEYASKNSPLRISQMAADFHQTALDGAQLADRIESCIRTAQPFSFVRVGEGEGCFLSYSKYQALRDATNEVFGVCAKDIYRIWFDKNIHEASKTDLDRISALFWDALASADVIGIPTPERVIYEYAHFISDMEKHGYSRGYVGIAEILSHLTRARSDGQFPSALVADCDIARPLYAWQEWNQALACTLPHILKGRQRVTVVTCHAYLSHALQRFLGIERVRTLQIPPERGRVKGGDMLNGDHFSDHFQRITSELLRDPGSIVIVAAGFLGKSYCCTAKAAGSVAVDIGSLADYWVGMNTRAKNAWTIPSPFQMAVPGKGFQ